MKHLSFLLLGLALFMFASCGNNEKKAPVDNVEQNDSLQRIISQKDSEINDMMETFNQIQQGLQEINEAEKRVNLVKDGEGSNKRRQIIENIQALNPDAQILIVGATNPVPLLSSWTNYFNKLNKYEKQLADVYGCTYVAVPFAQTELDGHPTVAGHKYIARKIVRAIEANQ